MPRRHAVLALVVAVCWAVNFVVIDIGLESFPPLLFAALRFGLIAFPAIFFVPRPDVRWSAIVGVGLFICVGQFGVLFVAMHMGLPAGLASVIAPLQPVFTIPLAAVALGERPSLRQVAGVSLAVAGIGAIAAGRAQGVPLLAVALGIASAASWGCGNVVTRAAGTTRPFALLVWSSVVGPVPLVALSLIFEGTARWQHAASSVGASGIAALAYVVIVSTFFGYGTWYRLISRYPASTVAPFTLIVPVVGIFTAWLVRGEHPTWGEVLGSLIVLVGLALALGLVDALAARRSRGPSLASRFGTEPRSLHAVTSSHGPEAALALLDELDLADYRYYHSTRADLLRRLGRDDEARAAYTRALQLTDPGPESGFLEARLVELGGDPHQAL